MQMIGILAMASALAMSAFPAARGQQVTLAAQAQTNAAAFRDQIGRRLTFVCPANVNINQDIYGTDVYTDTSPICTAAAHAGLFTKGTSTAVTIVMAGRKESFTATNRNKVQSLAYGPWAGTYSFSRTSQPGQIEWNTTIVQVASDYLTPLTLVCPPAGPDRGDIWGTDVYPDDSAICVAGVHAGVITLEGGTLTVTRVEKQASFPSTTRNQITSRLWSDPAWRSYPQPYTVSNAGSVGTSGSAGSTIRAAGTGTIATTTTPPPTVIGSIGATAGPVTSATNPVATSKADLFGPPAPRTISLSPFTAGGVNAPTARMIGLPAFTAAGTLDAVSSRTITLPQFNAAGGATAVPASRTIVLTAFSASGSAITIATRSIAQSATSGAVVLPAPRTIGLPGFQAQGGSSLIASRTVELPAYSAVGGTAIVTSRTLTLPAYTGVGAPGIAPRTIKLPTFTSVGIP